MSFKDTIEKLKKEAKFVNAFRSLFYIVGIILVFIGGIELMTMFFVGFFAFFIGKYYERTMSVVRDYRLSQKINKNIYKQAEFESMQKELDLLRKTIQFQRPQQPMHSQPLHHVRPTPPPQYFPSEFESEVY